MGGRLSFSGYNITLKNLIEEKYYMSELYKGAMHDLTGDKRELLFRLASEESESVQELTHIYKTFFISMPETDLPQTISKVSIKDLVRYEADNALHFSHMANTAPCKHLSALYKAMAQKATNHGYLLLLIL